VQIEKSEKKHFPQFPTIGSCSTLKETSTDLFLIFFNHMDWKIIAIKVKRIIIFGPFFTGSAYFESPKDEFFAKPTFIFLKISKKNHVT
jgi:hypothetical protein